MTIAAEIIEELREEFASPDHRTTSEIAATLGVTKNTVIGALRRAGIRSAKTADQRAPIGSIPMERICEVVAEHVTWVSAAVVLGVSANTLGEYCRRKGIHLKPAEPKRRLPKERTEAWHSRALWENPVVDGQRRRRPWKIDFRNRAQSPLSERDAAEMRRLTDEAIAAGRITKCPPAWAAGSVQLSFERLL